MALSSLPFPLSESLQASGLAEPHPSNSADDLLGSGHPRMRWLVRGLLLAWIIIVCVVPDPRPLGAPDWIVERAQQIAGMSEPTARAAMTGLLRASALVVLGVLVAASLGAHRARRWGLIGLVIMPTVAGVLAVLVTWINRGYFPIRYQLQLAVLFAVLGSLSGLVLCRSRVALLGLVAVIAGLTIWNLRTGVSDDLYESARATGLHVLDLADDIPGGHRGFAALMEEAFAYAEDNSHGTDPVFPNQAAILALGVILGGEEIAAVGHREIDMTRASEFEALRERVGLYGHQDWPRHFWISAALTVLTGEERTMAVGIAKEVADTSPGRTGFSFPDLAADRAGCLFALAATRDAESARAMQARILSGVKIKDFFPDVRDLPEGLHRNRFENNFGGLGGERTQQVADDIRARLAACEGLR